jgi:hypothetical protein
MKRGSRKFSDDAVFTRETSAISRIDLVGQTEELSKLSPAGVYIYLPKFCSLFWQDQQSWMGSRLTPRNLLTHQSYHFPERWVERIYQQWSVTFPNNG